MPKRTSPKTPHPEPKRLALLLRAEDKAAIKYVVDVLRAHDGKWYETCEAIGIARRTLEDIANVAPTLKAEIAKHKTGRATDLLEGTDPATGERLALTRNAWADRIGISRSRFYKRMGEGKTGAELFAPSTGTGAKPRRKKKIARTVDNRRESA